MTERFDIDGVSRRNVLRTGTAMAGAGIVGGAGVAGSASANQGSLVSKINSKGHWKLFAGADADGEPLNLRSKNPLDIEAEKGEPDDPVDARWVCEPASGGSVRLRIEDDPEVVGFDFDMGSFGEIEEVTITGSTEESPDNGDQRLWVGTYFDTQDTGDYFEWERYHGNTESFAGFGDDTECLTHIPMDGEVQIDLDYVWGVVIVPQDVLSDANVDPTDADNDWLPIPGAGMHFDAGVTWQDYRDGKITVEGEDIPLDTGPETEVALPVNLRGSGPGTIEEAVIDDVFVTR